MSAPEIVSISDRLKKMRAGRKQELKIVCGELEIPVRILSASEETAAICNAKTKVLALTDEQRELVESAEIMKAILERAGNVDNTPYLSRAFLEELSTAELTLLYDEYQSLLHAISPKFESLSRDEIAELISAVKKKGTTTSSLYTWQLAAIGKFFLDEILPRASEAGS